MISFLLDNLDEGTLFVSNPGSTEDVIGFFTQRSPGLVMYENENDVKELVDMYPDDPSEGSPYNTGEELFGQQPEYKREASIYNDLIFTVRRPFHLFRLVVCGYRS